MKLPIIQIGNSKGLRLPQTLLKQFGLEDEVEIEIRADELAIKSIHKPRQNWDLAFQNMHKNSDDNMFELATQTAWDKAEWEW